MSRRRHRTMSFSYPHSQIERQIDSFLETFKKRSAAAMERAQSLQGGPGGLLSPYMNDTPSTPPIDGPKIRSPRRGPKVKFHIPGRRNRWTMGNPGGGGDGSGGGRGGLGRGSGTGLGVPRSRSGVSVASSDTDSGSDSLEAVTRSLPHSLHTWASSDSIPGQSKSYILYSSVYDILLHFHAVETMIEFSKSVLALLYYKIRIHSA